METITLLSDGEVIALSRDGQTFWLDVNEAEYIIELLTSYAKGKERIVGTKTTGKK